MGLRMDNIHSPTVEPVGSGPSSADSGNSTGQTLEQLNAQKERLESELSALGSVLDSHGVNMRTSLTTFDGYPRADIDVAQVRITRARIIHLRNDHKAVLVRIETAVHARFAELAAQEQAQAQAQTQTQAQARSPANPSSRLSSNNTSNGSTSRANVAGPATTLAPFARVNSVSPDSPAADAGLRVGDRITKFGDADWLNHEKLARVAQVVARNEGRVIAVSVLRTSDGGEESQTLSLTPRRDWGGRGSLGCHLLPL